MEHRAGFYETYIKRLLDIVLAGLALLLLSPLMLIVAILVRCKLGAPVIFCQERPGKNEKIFRLYKFRTMTDEYDAFGEPLPDEMRLTPFGQFLRSTSLDELPELWNIFKGDMSLVGPRPLLVEYLPYYTDDEQHRHDVMPGLTGLAQINGRNNLTWEQKFAYDLTYVQNISFSTDTHIFFTTFLKVIRRNDVQTNTHFSEGNLAQIRAESLDINGVIYDECINS